MATNNRGVRMTSICHFNVNQTWDFQEKNVKKLIGVTRIIQATRARVRVIGRENKNSDGTPTPPKNKNTQANGPIGYQ